MFRILWEGISVIKYTFAFVKMILFCVFSLFLPNKEIYILHIFFNREMMYQVVEDTLFNMGMNGKGCLLRAICEMFQFPLKNHGFFGEVLELFFR